MDILEYSGIRHLYVCFRTYKRSFIPIFFKFIHMEKS